MTDYQYHEIYDIDTIRRELLFGSHSFEYRDRSMHLWVSSKDYQYHFRQREGTKFEFLDKSKLEKVSK